MADRSEDAHYALLYRAQAILEGRANGHALPILRLLAARRFVWGLNLLGDFVSPNERLRLHRVAAASGDPIILYNLAIEYRNRGDMGKYRHWLARAARLDPDAREELRTFATRFPYECMRRHRRLRRDR